MAEQMKLSFLATTASKIDELPIVNGQFILIKDINTIAVDMNDKRTKYEQIITLASDSDRFSILAPVNGVFYFVVETNSLWKYDQGWKMICSAQSAIPTGGSNGQILKKKSDSDYDVEWQDDTGGSVGVEYDAEKQAIVFENGGGEGTIDPEQIKQAVNGYLEENPVSGMTTEQEQQLNQNTQDVADLKSTINQKGLPEGGTTGQVLTKKSDADYDAEWVTIASLTEPEENNYELVGTTPLQINDGSWFVKPEVETVISNSESFSEGVVKNIAEDASPYELSEFITSLEVEQNKNKIKMISHKANSNIQPFYYIWFPTEVGKKYTFFVTTDSGRKNQYIYGEIFPAENVSDLSQRVENSYMRVDSGKGFTFESSKNYAGFSYAPWNDTSEHTNTYYLFEGEYQSIPEGGSNITLTVQPGEKKVLSAFSGTILYANPETKVYKNVDGVNESPKETIICFGDSIMQLCKIPEYINEKYETDMYNLGVSGATVSYRGESSDGNNAYDFVNIVDSLGNNDLSIQIEKGQNQNFESLLGLMSKANILIVEYGTNDFQGMKSLTGEENTTVEGAYNYCLNKLSQLYPYKKIIVLSTLGYTLVGDNNGNYDILQLKEKVKEICDTLHFPFVDMMTLSNITDSNKTVFLEDGVHPKTENGRKRYGDALYYALKTIIGV